MCVITKLRNKNNYSIQHSSIMEVKVVFLNTMNSLLIENTKLSKEKKNQNKDNSTMVAN